MTLLLRDPYLCRDINELHCNTRYLKVSQVDGIPCAAGLGMIHSYSWHACCHQRSEKLKQRCKAQTHKNTIHSFSLQDFVLPANVTATTSAAEAIAGAQFAIHAVPVQHTRVFLKGIKVRLGFGACLLRTFWCVVLQFKCCVPSHFVLNSDAEKSSCCCESFV